MKNYNLVLPLWNSEGIVHIMSHNFLWKSFTIDILSNFGRLWLVGWVPLKPNQSQMPRIPLPVINRFQKSDMKPTHTENATPHYN